MSSLDDTEKLLQHQNLLNIEKEKAKQTEKLFIQDNPNNLTSSDKNKNKTKTNFFSNLPELTDEIEEIPNYSFSSRKLNYNKNLSSIAEEIKEFEKIAATEAHKAKKHEYCAFMHFLTFLLCVVILYFSLVFQTELSNADFSYFTSIGENWRLSPLKDVYLGKGNCDKPADNVLSDAWPGLLPGCECSKEIFKGECPKNRLDCVPLKKYDSKRFTYWQANNICANKKFFIESQNNYNNNNDKIFENNYRRIKTENNIGNNNNANSFNSGLMQKEEIYPNYFDFEISEKNYNSLDRCPDNFKNCGVIDSYGNYLCLPYGEACPINNINVKNILQNKNFYSNGPNNLETSEINNEKISSNFKQGKQIEKNMKLKNSDFAFSNVYNPLESKIPVEFAVGFNQPCRNPFYINANFYVFYLDPYFGKQKCFQYADDINPKLNLFTFNNKQYRKGLYLDSSYALIDKYPYRDLLIDNNIYQQFDRIPVSYNDQLNQDIGLYSKGYFGIAAKCHREIKAKNLAPKIFSAIENLKSIDRIVHNVSAIVGLSAFNLGFIMFFFVASLSLSTLKLEEINSGNYSTVKFFTAFLFFIILSLIAIFILSTVNTARLFAVGNLDVIFADPKCVDIFSHNIYYKYFSTVVTGKVLMITILSFSFSMFVVYVFYMMSFVKSHVIGKNNNEEREIQNNEVDEEEKESGNLNPIAHRTYITLNE